MKCCVNSLFSVTQNVFNHIQRHVLLSEIQTLRDLYARAKVFDPFALNTERKKIRTALDIQGKERIKKKLNRNPNPELYKQSADRADEVIGDLDIEFMPPVNKKPSRNKEQQRAREPQKPRTKQTKGPEMVL